MKYEVEYKGKNVTIEKLPNGKFKKPSISEFCKSGRSVTWLDDGRIPFVNNDRNDYGIDGDEGNPRVNTYGERDRIAYQQNVNGRFPANLLVCDDALNTGQDSKSPSSYIRGSDSENKNCYGKGIGEKKGTLSLHYGDSGSFSRYFDLDAWFDTKLLPKEAQKSFPFMIIPKASKSEKAGATHPTVKPVKLFSWLMTIGSRKGDIILDPFLGSGTALEAGYLIGRDVMGFEISNDWKHLYPARAHTHQGSLEDWF